ncbi:CHAT domain-containing protein [Pseudomonas yamanorum]|uniref:CHAT domain-containing protein n=1 Tax=Pseudomonas yamanorum TaxID=515393 RepID=A0AAJ3LHW4_9PSED|nr:CHAT domain-containing protein [Pseudomonas yamanorum]NWD43718.1 CHAT domain-containing protein [Pseudomonas yamanorum]
MNESETQQAIDVEGFDPRQIFSKGFDLGAVDLIQGGSFEEVIGRTLVTLICAKDEDDRGLFSGISVVLPPVTVTTLTADRVHTALSAGLKALSGAEPNEKKLEFLKNHTQVVSSPTLEIPDLVATVSEQGPSRLIAIVDASLYRDEGITAPSAFGVSSVLASEDLWVPHVALLCSLCVSSVKATNGFAVVHVDETPAMRDANVALLVNVEDCYVTALHREPDAKDEVEQNAQRWLSLLLRGELANVVAEIDEMQLPDINRLHVLAQLFSRAGMSGAALETLAQLVPHLTAMNPANCVQISWLAHKAGDDELALEFLPEKAEDIESVMWIEQALELATLLEKNSLIERYDKRLALLSPSSAHLRENRDRRLLMNCRDATLGTESVYTTAGFTEHHLKLLDGVLSPQQEYGTVIEEATKWGKEWFELAVICCAMHAWHLGHSREASDAASRITVSELYGRQATQITLSSVRTLMLKEEIGRDERDYYRKPVQSILRFLAQHPEDSSIRSGLSRLLSVDSCGDIGVPIVAVSMLDFAGEGIRVATRHQVTHEPQSEDLVESQGPDEDTLKDVVEQGLKWLSSEGAGEHGVTVLPKELAIHPDHVIRLITRIILMSAPRGEDVDVDFLEKLVLLACAMCPYATEERNADLRLLRLFAGQCATIGQYQRARNLAEQLLLIGQGNAPRSRLAWLAFADIYHRCHNLSEALVGLACAMATDAPVEKSDLWQEVHTAIRVLRDLGLYDLANIFLPSLKELTADLGHDANNDPRIVALDLSLRLMKVEAGSEDLGKIVDELSSSCKAAMNDRSFLLPLVVLLGQAIQRADTDKLHISDDTRDLLAEGLRLVGSQASHLIQTVSTMAPLASDVTEMFNRVQRGLYASDAASDFAFVSVAARRLLDDSVGEAASGEDKALAVELLADHAVSLPDVPPPLEINWPTSYARSLNEIGLDVAFIGVDSAGELSVTYVSNGEIQCIEQTRHPRSFKLRLLKWLEDYPRNYGYIDSAHGYNEFFTTMEALDVLLPSSNSLVVIAEPMLQQVTLNLGIVKPTEMGGFSQFLGTSTAVGMVPSLTWFSMVRSSKRSGRIAYKAWISAEDGPEMGGPLDLALDRLKGTFNEFGFTVNTDRKLPQDISDAGLAVVTAHGGLTENGRYIHSIRDEGSLIESPSALANTLAGVEVVILFVCSGGRIDKHPMNNTTVGLPKQLLDKGCRAVIASPWPLDVKVTYRWLEPFLREWEAGSTILEATKKANQAVGEALGDSPQYSLAMTAFGDLLLTKN